MKETLITRIEFSCITQYIPFIYYGYCSIKSDNRHSQYNPNRDWNRKVAIILIFFLIHKIENIMKTLCNVSRKTIK